MSSFISILSTLGVFIVCIFVVIKNVKSNNKVHRKNTQIPKPKNTVNNVNSVGFTNKQKKRKSNTQFTEGTPTLKNVKTHPTTHVQTTEEDTDELLSDIIPDFTDEEEAKKAIITAEIINRKY